MPSLLGPVPGANRAPVGLAPRRTAARHLDPVSRSRCSPGPSPACRILSSGRPSAALTSPAAAKLHRATYTRHGLPHIQPRCWSDRAAAVQHPRGSSELRSRRASVNGRSTSLVCSAAASWAIADGADANRLALVSDSVEVRPSHPPATAEPQPPELSPDEAAVADRKNTEHASTSCGVKTWL